MSGEAQRRFLDLDVGEVSLVGVPANEVEFLVAKSKGQEAGMAGEVSTDTTEVVKTTDPNKGESSAEVLKSLGGLVETIMKGMGVQTPASATVTTPPTPATDTNVNKMAPVASEPAKVAKGATITDVLKAAGVPAEQITSVMNLAKEAGHDLASPTDTQKDADGAAPLTVESLAALITKAKQFTPSRVKKLQELRTTLDALIGEVESTPDVAPAAGTATLDSGIKKGAESSGAPAPDFSAVVKSTLAEILAPVVKSMEDMKGEIAILKSARPLSNSLEGEGGTNGKTKVEKSFWGGIFM